MSEEDQIAVEVHKHYNDVIGNMDSKEIEKLAKSFIQENYQK